MPLYRHSKVYQLSALLCCLRSFRTWTYTIKKRLSQASLMLRQSPHVSFSNWWNSFHPESHAVSRMALCRDRSLLRPMSHTVQVAAFCNTDSFRYKGLETIFNYRNSNAKNAQNQSFPDVDFMHFCNIWLNLTRREQEIPHLYSLQIKSQDWNDVFWKLYTGWNEGTKIRPPELPAKRFAKVHN